MRTSILSDGKLPVLLLICSLVLLQPGCGLLGGSPFPGGVRVITLASEVEFFGIVSLPVPNVIDSGLVLLILGAGRGTDETFGPGRTNFNGIDDHPSARTNARWDIVTDWRLSPDPGCGRFEVVHDANLAGLIEEITCFI